MGATMTSRGRTAESAERHWRRQPHVVTVTASITLAEPPNQPKGTGDAAGSKHPLSLICLAEPPNQPKGTGDRNRPIQIVSKNYRQNRRISRKALETKTASGPHPSAGRQNRRISRKALETHGMVCPGDTSRPGGRTAESAERHWRQVSISSYHPPSA